MEQQGFVHCDMKPINVLVTLDRVVKIIDLAKPVNLAPSERIQGTPGYMAEQAHRQEITPATDVYNPAYDVLGVVRPGHSDHTAASWAEQWSDHRGSRGAIPKPPVPADEVNRDVPNIVAKTIQEAVDPDPAKRISMSSSWNAWKWHKGC